MKITQKIQQLVRSINPSLHTTSQLRDTIQRDAMPANFSLNNLSEEDYQRLKSSKSTVFRAKSRRSDKEQLLRDHVDDGLVIASDRLDSASRCRRTGVNNDDCAPNTNSTTPSASSSGPSCSPGMD